jgi:hypothetical protein
MTYHRKLIEGALSLEAINKARAREQSIRHGHPSTCTCGGRDDCWNGSSAGGDLRADECTPRTLRAPPFNCEPDFGVTSMNDDFHELLTRGEVLA